ncbi:tyrosine-type recombinase/integrase [Pseudomonas aeruginosa]|uniref:tyrosine-type recombinase/integrase n=1 Tax=Pseudomonas aeruginosa TaxID=287 RepID=UPI001495D952|nr:tyrosine-type recombinase/integrase [Pseudomonas aeruginosa]HDK9341714.1 tyrosine-type recombinase/integrase [Staphylococcus aureus]EIU3807041.1 tyrosine-type recombinase/integrase [Pseudomonas aeruginosa]EIU3912815.1 tyrosine-type recombinase/integrase [Pseudomonas aeruginosa]EIU3970593.1 tyrosine-type recombinase/integrase [Pseudomonas aeruginosa]MBX5969164.1 tyrosine-type recombinase/integrase [Pseudomonas aeruginosa]
MKRSEIKRRPLADTALASLKPEDTPYRELDGNGLYFRVKPNGQKSWNFRYKKPDGKWSWLGLGSYPEVSGSAARQKAAELRADASDGKSPLAAKHARKASELEAANSTFEALAREWIAVRLPGWAENTAKRTVGALELHAFPVFGKRLYTEIMPIEWMEFFKGMEQKGIIEQMGRVRRSCKEIYDLARVTGRAVHNPLDGLSRFLQSKPAENYAHVGAKELPALLRAIAAYPHAHDVRLGLRLLMLTGVRPSELREARWEEFDRDAGLWHIPADRMKKRRPHTVPLSRQALEALEQLHTLSSAYPLLFPGRNDRTKPRSNMTFNMALRRMGYEGRQTGHGFRHIASTTLREHGFAKEHVEAQLSHVEDGVAGVYNKAIYIEQRRTMMQWYADHLDNLERDNVVPIKRPA